MRGCSEVQASRVYALSMRASSRPQQTRRTQESGFYSESEGTAELARARVQCRKGSGGFLTSPISTELYHDKNERILALEEGSIGGYMRRGLGRR